VRSEELGVRSYQLLVNNCPIVSPFSPSPHPHLPIPLSPSHPTISPSPHPHLPFTKAGFPISKTTLNIYTLGNINYKSVN
jgi:hypothetical protein